MYRRCLLILLAVGGMTHVHSMANSPTPAKAESSADWRTRATATLVEVMHREPTWVGIHAAEALIRHGEGEQVRAFFLGPDGAAFPRIGRLRVLATLASEPAKNDLVREIETVFLDPAALDRKQAVETLAKLRHPLSPEARTLAQSLAAEMPASEAVLPLWSLHYSGDATAVKKLTQLLTAEDPLARQRAGYALRWIGTKDTAVLKALALAAEREAPMSLPRVFLLSSALQLVANPDLAQQKIWKQELFSRLTTGPSAAAYEAGQTLGPWVTPKDIPELLRLLSHPEGDTQIGAALLLLSFASRS